MNETDIAKNKLRMQVKNMRLNMNKSYKSSLDNKITAKLIESGVLNNADTVLIYKSTDIEVSTDGIIEYCLKSDKKIAIPRCFEGHRMKFYYYDGNEELERSKYGILEPYENIEHEVVYSDNTVCIVPALAIDKTGYRLGYGGGFYDRFLAEHSNILPVIICYSENIIDSLVHDQFDRRAALAVTENGPEVCNE